MTNFARRHGLPEQLEDLERRLYELERMLLLGGSIQAGTVVAIGTGAVFADGSVVFAESFEGDPSISVFQSNGSVLEGYAVNISPNGFTARVRRRNDASIDPGTNPVMMWIAVERTQ